MEQPLHFTSQQPSSPTFSPTHIHAAPSLLPPPPAPPADVDMSTSTTTLPPVGQRHDRDDADMHDGEGVPNELPADSQSNPEATLTNSVAVEVAAVDEDVMDTTPDTEVEIVLPNSSAAPTSPAPDGHVLLEPTNTQSPPTGVDDAVRTTPSFVQAALLILSDTDRQHTSARPTSANRSHVTASASSTARRPRAFRRLFRR